MDTKPRVGIVLHGVIQSLRLGPIHNDIIKDTRRNTHCIISQHIINEE